jgi:ABC-type amino acid transport substrate-binding protein
LVVYNRGGFYYDKGRPRGIVVETLDDFTQIINKKLKTGAKKFTVVYISLPPGQLLQALNDGLGDVICSSLVVTPEREKLVDFTEPFATGVKLVPVTHKGSPAISSVDDLGGKDIYVNPLAVAKEALDKLNQQFAQAGKPQIAIHPVGPT